MTQSRRTIMNAVIAAMAFASMPNQTFGDGPAARPSKQKRSKPKSHNGNKLAKRLKDGKRLFRV